MRTRNTSLKPAATHHPHPLHRNRQQQLRRHHPHRNRHPRLNGRERRGFESSVQTIIMRTKVATVSSENSASVMVSFADVAREQALNAA